MRLKQTCRASAATSDFGSNSEVGARNRHVRFPPDSDQTADIAGGPFRANGSQQTQPGQLVASVLTGLIRSKSFVEGCSTMKSRCFSASQPVPEKRGATRGAIADS